MEEAFDDDERKSARSITQTRMCLLWGDAFGTTRLHFFPLKIALYYLGCYSLYTTFWNLKKIEEDVFGKRGEGFVSRGARHGAYFIRCARHAELFGKRGRFERGEGGGGGTFF